MQIHDLNTKALTDPAYVAFDDGSDTYKADFKQIIDDSVAEAYTDADVSGGVVNFTSYDEIPLSDWNYTEFASLEGGESLQALFELLSKIALNIRWLYGQTIKFVRGTQVLSNIAAGSTSNVIVTINVPDGYTAVGVMLSSDGNNAFPVWVSSVSNTLFRLMYENHRTSTTTVSVGYTVVCVKS